MKPTTPEEVSLWLNNYFKQRPDIGLWKALLNITFYAPSPFNLQVRRLPKAGFLLGAGFFAFAIGWCAFFNFAR